jgi:putative salt-induced outer membrane protein YdiY
MRRQLLALLFFCGLVSLCSADQVVLKNGDHFTGTVAKSDAKTLLLKTDAAGDITIQWDAIQNITSAQSLHVATQDGRTLVGTVTTTDGSLAVLPQTGAAVSIDRANVVALRNDAEQAAYDKTLHPGWMQGWAGGANVGFALTRGNSETSNLGLAFTADRKTQHDDISMYANSVYATNDAPGAVPSTTANTIQAGARYARNLTPRLFGYGGGDFQTDALQDLNLRSVLGGGLGLHAIKSDRTTMDFLGGLVYTRENYSTFTRNFVALSLGEELSQKLGKATVVTEKAYFFPDLSDTGEYRGTFNLGTVTKINKWFGWQNAFGDVYVTNPPAGTKKNDIILTTGLNFSFTH